MIIRARACVDKLDGALASLLDDDDATVAAMAVLQSLRVEAASHIEMLN